MVQLTKNLHVPAIQAHGSGAQVWHSAAVRKGRLKAVIISTAVFIVLAAASIFLLALVTLPAVLAPFARDRVVKPLPQEPNDGTWVCACIEAQQDLTRQLDALAAYKDMKAYRTISGSGVST